MQIQHLLIPELQYEVVLTEKFLRRIPEDKMEWRPHPKSMSIKELANHLAEIPSWATVAMETNEMEMKGYKSPSLDSIDKIVELLKNNANQAEEALRKPNEAFEELWKMTMEGNTLLEMPKLNVLRTMVLSQLPHHRAQLGVYFRLLDIPVPASYGPSADEK